MTTPLSRLSLLWKTVLSTSVAITALFAVAGWIAVRNATRAMRESIQHETQASFQAYQSIWKSRVDRLSSISGVLSAMSDVRASFRTGDEATIRDTAGELWSRVSEEDAIFLVASPTGHVVASLGGGAMEPVPHDLPVVREAASRFPSQASGFLERDGRLYHVAVTPVYVQYEVGSALLDVLVAGYEIGGTVAENLKAATGGSEFVFLANDRVVASTLDPAASAGVVARLSPSPTMLRVGGSEYASLVTTLSDVNGRAVGRLAILRSFDDAGRSIAGLRRDLSLLWICTLVAGLGITCAMAWQIVGPVKALDRAAAEVARQNYDTEVRIERADELGRLAATFNAMCASIRQAREDLVRSERIATVGRLAASIVHDLRNPLAAIYGGAEMLMESKLSGPQVQRLSRNMYQASRRIQTMLQDLLEQGGGGTHIISPCNLRELAARVAESFAPLAESQSVRIAVNIPADLVLPVDGHGIERVLANLIGNALEAMPEGGEIVVAAETEADAVVVSVRDNGPGIAPELRGRLFQPFATTRKRNGLGLGLAFSRQAVIGHGGDMWADSEPGQGASFSFRLPK